MSADETITKFTAVVEHVDEQFIVSVPENEIKHGELSIGETIKVEVKKVHRSKRQGNEVPTPVQSNGGRSTSYSSNSNSPVNKGDELESVNIVSVGDEGDGIAKMNDGFVLIVPDTEVGDTVDVEVTEVFDSYAMTNALDENG